MNIFRHLWYIKFLETPIRKSRNPKGFGFAEYANADSVLRALRVLGGEGSGDGKKDRGVVKADENTRKYLDQYEGLTVCIKL
ncbi:hypothetical protein RhiirC2_859389 [Rhizophagus irregularis]|uniref:RRM domain-containing protein n=1 Tax=Rhizophagus irregularis TaxID=588596 RepID=A0A2N1KHP1_9GLOM|nr:hypothetical protein RhiirC2_859411 [Rhizophagus irregularis]PKK39891.1 hypothetical protein RhiirC2_859389 [Rhizophagus irregularis]